MIRKVTASTKKMRFKLQKDLSETPEIFFSNFFIEIFFEFLSKKPFSHYMWIST